VGGPALFLTALFLATLGSRDMLLLPLVAKFLGPEGMGRAGPFPDKQALRLHLRPVSRPVPRRWRTVLFLII
jgi:hypothetical protein